MPMMATLPNGSLALAWQGSVVAYEGSNKQALYWTTSNDDGMTWQPHSLLRAPRAGMPLWGPVFHTPNASTMLLFYAESNPRCRWGGETGEGAWSPGGVCQGGEVIFHTTFIGCFSCIDNVHIMYTNITLDTSC